jgi:uncharacterized protein (DUF488 family)
MLYTVGHGTRSSEELLAVLRSGGVGRVVDVRRFPGSRRHPHLGREPLAAALATADVGYEWAGEALGGRRSGVEASRHPALRNAAFRAYADHMASAEFAEGMAALLGHAEAATTAVMCAESLWWRCHRRLLADAVVLTRAGAVDHVMHDGRRAPHVVTDGARAAGRLVVYDVGVDRGLPL